MEAITRRLERDKRGISNVIVVMLSLVLVTIIVGNVVLWSYQMNQLDLERMQEIVSVLNVTRVTRSSWFTAQDEYSLGVGSRLTGSFIDTKALDGSYEAFREEKIEILNSSDVYRLNISNSFVIDLSVYPLDYIHGLEVSVRYNVTDDAEKWFLKAYNWTEGTFCDIGFNTTGGDQPILNNWNAYAINVANDWADYVSENGTLLVEFLDEGVSRNQGVVEADFVGVRAITDGTQIEMSNSGPFTAHVIAIWIVNSTIHQRYNANLFVNSGESIAYVRTDIRLPEDDFIARIVTEKGNISIFA